MKLRLFLIVVVSLFIAFPSNAVTASEAFSKAKTKLSSAKSISADFNMKIGGNTIKGKIQSKGSKFAITSNATSNWYNGKDLYTYNASSKETTVFNPKASELAEVNPLLYISSAPNFDVKATKTQKSGVETVVLVPKKSGTGVKSVTLELDSSTYLPRTITVAPTSGAVIQISISNLKLNGSVAESVFDYPKSKYPGVKIYDLR